MKPRLLRLFVVMLALVAAFIWLGDWQWRVAHNKANQQVLETSSARAIEPLDEVLKPQTQFANERSLQPVRVTGHYDASKTELVADRVLDGAHGWWLMTPLVADSTGARIPVVRGFVTSTTGLPKPASGSVTVEGAVAPSESVSTTGTLPAGQIGTIDMGLLLNQWGGRVYNGFIFSTKQTPADPTAAAAVRHIPPPVPTSTKIDWRNAAYAWQWWIFAVFAVFMWWRQVREEHADDEAAAQAVEVGVPEEGRDGVHHDVVGHTDDIDRRSSSPEEGNLTAGDEVVAANHDTMPAATTSATREDTA